MIIKWGDNGLYIRANTAWHACNEEVCGSPVRSLLGGVWQYTGRPWMATERAVDRSASVCRMPCGVRVRTCGARTQFSPRSEHLDVPCLPGSFRGLLSLPQMASLPESGQGLRLYEHYSRVCKCMFSERARLSTMLSVLVCRYLA